MRLVDRAKKIIQEIIGRWSSGDIEIQRTRLALSTIDLTKPDYAYWDRFRRGKVKGYYLASLFVRRIEKLFSSWVFGSGFELVTVDGDVYTDKQLQSLTKMLLDGSDHDILAMQIYENTLGLGDQYILVNSDASLCVPSPDTVVWTLDELDYTNVISVELITRTPKYQISDLYTITTRTVTVKQAGKIFSIDIYDNLIGEIPFVHSTNGQGINERYGHSLFEPLLPLFDLFDDIQIKQSSGSKILGNPILAFTGLKNLKEVKDANKPAAIETYVDRDGRTITRNTFKIDQDSVLLVGEGGDVKFLAPPIGFTKDTRSTLDSLFLLLIYHIGIPAFIWGAEMGQARASSETQMSQWVHDVEGIQQVVSNWLLKLAKVWLKTKHLVDRKINLTSELTVKWKPLVTVDENMLLKRLQFAKDHGLITSETTLKLLQLVDDAKQESLAGGKEELKRATESMKAKQTDLGAIKTGSLSVQQMEEFKKFTSAKQIDLDKFTKSIKEMRDELLRGD